MKKFIAATLISVSSLACSWNVSALDNNSLYRWKTKDGTPTYSPEPPPAGVDYVVVDADLKPLPVQPARSPAGQATVQPASQSTPTRVPVKLTPPPIKKQPKWKPVRYAQDPSLSAKQLKKNTAEITSSSKPGALATTTTLSDSCIVLKRDKLVMESAFAEADTDAQMDQAILNLKETTERFRRECQ